jgi:curved DNA-binding protein CbpA
LEYRAHDRKLFYLSLLWFNKAKVTQHFKDYYNILGIPFTATEADIKSGYRKMARLFHPDMHPEDPEGFTAKFQEITEAHDVLSDVFKKNTYDLQYRQLVLGEMPHYETYYYEPQEPAFYTTYEPPVDKKRKSFIPFGALLLLAIFFLRMVSNTAPTEPVYKYDANVPISATIQQMLDSLHHMDTSSDLK